MNSSSPYRFRNLVAELMPIPAAINARLYIGAGLSQLFRSVTDSDSVARVGSWLYFPDNAEGLTAAYWAKDDAIASTGYVATPLSTDDGMMFPILRDGRTIAVIVFAKGQTRKISSDIIEATARTAAEIEKHQEDIGRTAIGSFSVRLSKTQISLGGFHKLLLDQLIEVASPCLGGIYREDGDRYRLEVAAGNISLGEGLTRQLSVDLLKRSRVLSEEQPCYAPVGAFPDSPTLLSQPPGFVMISRSIRSAERKYLVLLQIRGDLGFEQSAMIHELAHYVSQLSEDHLTNSQIDLVTN